MPPKELGRSIDRVVSRRIFLSRAILMKEKLKRVMGSLSGDTMRATQGEEDTRALSSTRRVTRLQKKKKKKKSWRGPVCSLNAIRSRNTLLECPPDIYRERTVFVCKVNLHVRNKW